MLMIANAGALRADFLVLRIGESTAEGIRQWVFALVALVAVLTLRNSRSKGGQGN
jgi:hypothetical protein